jgi:hypothetical protein
MYRRHDDYLYHTLPPSEWKSRVIAEIQAENRRIKRRALRRAVLRAAAISVAVIVAAGYLVVMPCLAWINNGFGLALSGHLPRAANFRVN